MAHDCRGGSTAARPFLRIGIGKPFSELSLPHHPACGPAPGGSRAGGQDSLGKLLRKVRAQHCRLRHFHVRKIIQYRDKDRFTKHLTPTRARRQPAPDSSNIAAVKIGCTSTSPLPAGLLPSAGLDRLPRAFQLPPNTSACRYHAGSSKDRCHRRTGFPHGLRQAPQSEISHSAISCRRRRPELRSRPMRPCTVVPARMNGWASRQRSAWRIRR